jgi:epothilone polyketide synthase D
VLVTGGLGALGRHVAHWLVAAGVRHLVLLGRRGSDGAETAAAVQRLEAAGASVTVVAGDVAERATVERLLAGIPAAHPLCGVVHAAGLLDDGLVAGYDRDRLAAVMRPKVDGGLLLDELTRHLDLDYFVLYCSVAGVLGSPGQAAYAAASAALDALAQRRRAAGLPALSLDFGPWAEEGLAASRSLAHRQRLARLGFTAIDGSHGAELLGAAWTWPRGQLVVAPLEPQLLEQAFAGSPPPIWRRLVRRTLRPTAAASGGFEAAATLDPAARLALAADTVRAEVARVLGLPDASAVPAERPLKDLGLDSLMAVELRNGLARRLERKLPVTLAFDHPTPAAIARFLVDQLDASRAAPQAAPVVAGSDEPIAIVGIGCRYPGGIDGPATFWRLVAGGVDAITPVPAERWDAARLYDPDPDAPGRSIATEGGFVGAVDGFDAGFFGISGREADKLDPQQRLLLETSWEALERAGIPASSLAGTDTGVFVGIMYGEYGEIAGALETLDGYVGTGTSKSLASGRLSYLFGLHGPSLSVDTACSSSLVTTHLACQSLRRGECSLALAGGVTLMLTPKIFVEFSRLRGIAPDGRCKSFDAAADGVAWSEGAGMLVLERLSDARRLGHPVIAVIRSTAVNQDGRSNGLTAPSGPAQVRVVRRALAEAGLSADDIDYVECHGTGTRLGDPIEANALGEVFAGRPPDRPLLIGTVKTNFGHAQAAAGVAGIIKTALSLSHEQLPANLHFTEPSPHIPWQELPLEVVTRPRPWTHSSRPRRAGVSSFAISGTNAHVILEEAPPARAPALAPPADATACLLVLSAKSEPALRELAGKLAGHLGSADSPALVDLAHTLGLARVHHEWRLASVARTTEAARAELELVARGGQPELGNLADVRTGGGRLAWLFAGGGTQLGGMGQRLAAQHPVFRARLDEVCAHLDQHLERPIREVMWAQPGSPDAALLDEIAYLLPALFAVELALAAQWHAWGVEPDVLIGHSTGEIAAATIAGVFALSDAARLVAMRGRLMQALPERGAMIAIGAGEAEVEAALAAHRGRVSIAAVNAPDAVVISGAEAAVEAVAERLAARGRRTRRLAVSHASHSPLMDGALEALGAVVASMPLSPPQLAIISTVTGRTIGEEMARPAYWVRHLRAGVRFADAIMVARQAGVGRFLELGPKATLVGAVESCLPTARPLLVSSLDKERPEDVALLHAAGRLHVAGASLRMEHLVGQGRLLTDLPAYPWQRQHHWVETPVQVGQSRQGGHPFIGEPQPIGRLPGLTVWSGHVDLARTPWLADHAVDGTVLFPGTGYVDAFLAAARSAGIAAPELVNVTFEHALSLAPRVPSELQITGTSGEDGLELELASLAREPRPEFVVHARGRARSGRVPAAESIDLAAVRARLAGRQDPARLHDELAAVGLQYGPAFRGIAEVQRGPGEVLGRVVLPAAAGSDDGFAFHPALLDACWQLLVGMSDGTLDSPWLPISLERLTLHGRVPRIVHCHAVDRPDLAGTRPDRRGADVTITDGQGQLVMRLHGLMAQRLGLVPRVDASWWLGTRWPMAAAPPRLDVSGRHFLLAAAPGPLADGLAVALRRRGARVEALQPGGRLAGASAVIHVEAGGSSASTSVAALLGTIQLMLAGSPLPLVVVTRGAQAVAAGEPVAAESAALVGMVRTLTLEHGELTPRLVDLDPGKVLDEDIFDRLIDELLAEDHEDEVALRGGDRRVGRIEVVPPPAAERELPIGAAASYLITGGLGGLGLAAAEWLVERGARRIVLLGRSGVTTAAQRAQIAALEARGAEVEIHAADVTDMAAMARIIAGQSAARPVRGVIHSVGVLDDGAIATLDRARLDYVLAPKVSGALALERALAGQPLDFALLYGSVAGLLGSPGQANHAAANTALAALAHAWRARGIPAQLIAWGPVSVIGAAASAEQQRILAGRGMGSISPAQALLVLEQVLRSDVVDIAVAPIRTERWVELYPRVAGALRLSGLMAGGEARSPGGSSMRAMLERLAPEERSRRLSELILKEAVRVLKVSAEGLHATVPFAALGLDSIQGLELRNRLERELGITVPVGLIFRFGHAEALAEELQRLLFAAELGGDDIEEIRIA